MLIFPTLLVGLWLMVPAYLPNSAAVLTGGGPPIDDGRTWRGARLLGDGKTWRGAAGGFFGGFVAALLMNAVHPFVSPLFGVPLPTLPLGVAVSLSLGAVLGDVVASFVKRRTGRERGEMFPLVDQLDFLVGALLLTAFVAPGWAAAYLPPRVVVTLFILTPLLHLTGNVVAYVTGFKDEPW